MWRRAAVAASGAIARRSWRLAPCHASSAAAGGKVASVSSAVNSIILRSLKEHYLEVSKMTPPHKVNPPSPFAVVKGSIDNEGPVLTRTYNDEVISLYVTRLSTIIPGGAIEENDDEINQLFVHIRVSKPQQDDALHFLCGLYPDALGIHSVSMRPKAETSGFVVPPSKYNGPVFEELDEKIKDALHGYIEERGINESLFPFLQAWLYVKDHRSLIGYFKSVGTFISEGKSKVDSKS